MNQGTSVEGRRQPGNGVWGRRASESRNRTAREYRVLARARADEESVPEEKGGSSCDPPRYFDENLTNFMLLCKLFNIIELFVNIFNTIQLLGDWQIPCIFSETITQND